MATIHNTTMTTGHCVLLTAQYVPSAGLESGGLRAGDEEEGAHGVQFAQGRLALRHLDRRDAQRPDVALWKEDKRRHSTHIHIIYTSTTTIQVTSSQNSHVSNFHFQLFTQTTETLIRSSLLH